MIRAAISDLNIALRDSFLWGTLAWADIRMRYRRSLLGPLWMTITMGGMIFGMGPVYASIFRQRLTDFYPYLALGFIMWGFISTVMNEACMTFISGETYIKQVPLALSHLALRVVGRNLIILAHHALLIIPIYLLVGRPVDETALLAVPGIFISAISALGVCYFLGALNARFRDVQQIVLAVTQLVFFLTPILWKPAQLVDSDALVKFNPFFYMIEVVRAPLLGEVPSLDTYIIAAGIATASFGMGFLIFSRFRTRLAYWV